MAGLDNPDMEVDFLRDAGDLAERLPGWGEDALVATAQYGIPAALALLVLMAWFAVRRRADAPLAVAGVAWAGLAAAVAFTVNAPIRGFVARPRPFADHPEDVRVLLDGQTGYSFVSDHASLAMAVAVGLFLVHRPLGAVAGALALLQGAARVLMGVHYPTDVVGGFALGTAVALLLAPLAMAGLTPLVRWAAGTRALRWLTAPPPPPGPPAAPPPEPAVKERGLAA